MNTLPLRRALLGLLAASGLAVLASTVNAQPNPADPSVVPPATKPDNRLTTNISGKVTAKTDNTLTVDNRTVTLTGATTFSKNGASIGSGDVKVGDTINIVTTDDGQVAVSVNVLVSS